jgi:hypothetical protein
VCAIVLERKPITTTDELLVALGLTRESDKSTIRAAMLAFAGRQPDSVDKLPQPIVVGLIALGGWPFESELEAAKVAGRAIRDVRFLEFPGIGAPFRSK